VLAGESVSLEEQLAQWEERKRSEKVRDSCMDDVPTGQPALALTQKVLERSAGAGIPDELIPDSLREVRIAAESDAENTLRTATLEFIDTVRRAEQAVKAARGGDAIGETPAEPIGADEWREHWPG